MERICRDCGKSKSIEDFYTWGGKKKGITARCKPCHNKWSHISGKLGGLGRPILNPAEVKDLAQTILGRCGLTKDRVKRALGAAS